MGTLLNLSIMLPASDKAVTGVYTTVHRCVAEDTSIRAFAQEAIRQFSYRSDPHCVRASCSAPPCPWLCGDDMWSTPHYLRAAAVAGSPWKEDCDGAELCAAGAFGGAPLFIPPQQGRQGHVLHLDDPAKLLAVGESSATDFSVLGGMRPWGGQWKAHFQDRDDRVACTVQGDRSSHRYRVWR